MIDKIMGTAIKLGGILQLLCYCLVFIRASGEVAASGDCDGNNHCSRTTILALAAVWDFLSIIGIGLSTTILIFEYKDVRYPILVHAVVTSIFSWVTALILEQHHLFVPALMYTAIHAIQGMNLVRDLKYRPLASQSRLTEHRQAEARIPPEILAERLSRDEEFGFLAAHFKTLEPRGP